MSGHTRRSPASRGFFVVLDGLAGDASLPRYDTIGSLKASISPSYSLIGTQLQNTFLSP